jgi:hypothetical protein
MPIHEYLPYLAIAWTAYFIAVVSPGPATLALAATSMTSGRAAGVSLALGVYTGSFIWACLTSLGLAAILTAYAGILTILKIVGGLYLLWLAWKSFKSAMMPNALHLAALANKELTRRQLYFKGLMLHLTNPMALDAVARLATGCADLRYRLLHRRLPADRLHEFRRPRHPVLDRAGTAGIYACAAVYRRLRWCVLCCGRAQAADGEDLTEVGGRASDH